MLEKFFRKEPALLKMDELHYFLLGRFERERKETESRLLSYANQLQQEFNSIRSIISELSSKQSNDQYANTVKARFCEKSLIAIGALPDPSNRYITLRPYVEKSHEAMITIGGLSMKEFRHLHSFKNEMARIAEKIKSIEQLVAQARKAVPQAMAEIDSIESMVSQMTFNRGRIEAIGRYIEKKKDERDSIRHQLIEQRSGAESLTQEASRYTEEKMKMIDIGKQARAISQRISHEFAGLDRVFRKFLYYGDVTKQQSALISEYIASPGDTFLERDDKLEIFNILEQLHAFRDKESIELDETKLARIEDIIRNAVLMNELKMEYIGLLEKKRLMEEEFERTVEPMMKKIRESGKAGESMEKDAARLENEIEEKQEEMRTAERKISDLRMSCEAKLSSLLNRETRIA